MNKAKVIVVAITTVWVIPIAVQMMQQQAHANYSYNCGSGEFYYQGQWWFYSSLCYAYTTGSHVNYIFRDTYFWYSNTGSNPWFYCCDTGYQEIYACPLDSGGHISGYSGNV